MKNHLFHRLYLSLESVHNTSLVRIIADKTKKAKRNKQNRKSCGNQWRQSQETIHLHVRSNPYPQHSIKLRKSQDAF